MKKVLLTLVAFLSVVAISWAAVPYYTGPQDVANLIGYLNSLANAINNNSGGGGGGGTPGGTNGQLQYNNNGAFGGYTIGSGLAVSGGALTATGVSAGVASIATICPTVGSATGAVTLVGSAPPIVPGNSPAYVTSYTVNNSDCGGATTLAATSAIAVTLGTAGVGGNFTFGWNEWYSCPFAQCTITTTTSTFNGGGSSLTIPAGGAAFIASDGQNYWDIVVPASGGGGGGISIGSSTISGGTNGYVLYNNSGVVGNLSPSALISTLGTAAQGDVLYYNGTAWVFLAPGTSGQFLETLGAGANPAWASAVGGGTVTSVAITAGTNVTTSGTCSGTSSISCTINASGGGGSPGGTNGQLQYNNGGAFGGYTIGSGLAVSGGALTATGGGGVPINNTSGNWYHLHGNYAPQAGVSVTANTIYCTFGYTGLASQTVKSIGGDVTSSAAGNTQFAIYSVAAGTLTLVDSTASMTTASVADISAAVANTTDVLSANTLYALCNNSSAAPTFLSHNLSYPDAGELVGSSAQTNVNSTASIIGKSVAQTFGTWPSTIALSTMADVITRLVADEVLQAN